MLRAHGASSWLGDDDDDDDEEDDGDLEKKEWKDAITLNVIVKRCKLLLSQLVGDVLVLVSTPVLKKYMNIHLFVNSSNLTQQSGSARNNWSAEFVLEIIQQQTTDWSGSDNRMIHDSQPLTTVFVVDWLLFACIFQSLVTVLVWKTSIRYKEKHWFSFQ